MAIPSFASLVIVCKHTKCRAFILTRNCWVNCLPLFYWHFLWLYIKYIKRKNSFTRYPVLFMWYFPVQLENCMLLSGLESAQWFFHIIFSWYFWWFDIWYKNSQNLTIVILYFFFLSKILCYQFAKFHAFMLTGMCSVNFVISLLVFWMIWYKIHKNANIVWLSIRFCFYDHWLLICKISWFHVDW